MTLAEFEAKWKSIPCEHAEGCPKRFSFDFEECVCGHDELWDQRNADLATVSSVHEEDA